MPAYFSRYDGTEPWKQLPDVWVTQRDKSDILEDEYPDGGGLTYGDMISLQESLRQRIDDNQRDEEDEDY